MIDTIIVHQSATVRYNLLYMIGNSDIGMLAQIRILVKEHQFFYSLWQ